jgi:SAM-dependent methyltransferase
VARQPLPFPQTVEPVISPTTPNPAAGYDRLARYYRAIELLAYGRALERARFAHFDLLRDRRDILLLGDGDGRGLALACQLAPRARITTVDFSAGMLARAATRLSADDRARVTFVQADARSVAITPDTHDAIVTLFFLDCFAEDEARAVVARHLPALAADGIWIDADFALPGRGFSRLRARFQLRVMIAFFRWQTGLRARALPPVETLLREAGLSVFARRSWQGGFIRAIACRRSPAKDDSPARNQ